MAEFHFAWVDPSETTFVEATHARMDESVFAFEINHAEGEFAFASIEVRVPESGLLNASHKKYAWLSVTNESTTTPLMFGRLTAFPKSITGPTVTLELIAQFPGWQADREALFATLKVLPYWDTAFIPADQLTDPEMALEARTKRYHYHRTTGAVSLSDLLIGGTAITVSNHLRDSLATDIIGHPARRVNIKAVAEWEQRIINFSTRVGHAIRFAFGGTVNSFTGDALAKDWPKPGDTIGGNTGYQVVLSRIRKIGADKLPTNMTGDSTPFFAPVPEDERATIQAATGQTVLVRQTQVERSWFDVACTVIADWRQKRTETITATVENDVQALVFDDDQIEADIDLQAEDILDLNLMPAWYSSYFLTTRGRQSFHHLLARAKAKLALSARAVEIAFEVPFFSALAWSCDHQVTLEDDQLPGGTATGKVISYRLACDANGVLTAAARLGVSVGNGMSYVLGSPAVVDSLVDGGLDGDCQAQEGESDGGTGLEDMIYELYDAQKPTDPAAAHKVLSGRIVQSVTVTNGPDDQEAYLVANQYPERDNLAAALNEVPTEIELELYPLAAEDDVSHEIEVTMVHPWAAPQGIDLAA